MCEGFFAMRWMHLMDQAGGARAGHSGSPRCFDQPLRCLLRTSCGIVRSHAIAPNLPDDLGGDDRAYGLGIRPHSPDPCLGLCPAAFSIQGRSHGKMPFSQRKNPFRTDAHAVLFRISA